MKSRLLAAFIHFLFSATIIGLFLGMVFFIWYPQPYHIIHGVYDVVQLLVGVDLVLGPLLMLVIFNVSKPKQELIRDISIIVLFQVVALLWGGHIAYKMRPLFVVFQETSFHTVVRQDIHVEKLSQDLKLPSMWQQPALIYIEPLTSEEKVQLVVDVLSGKVKDIMFQAERYRPFTNYQDDVLALSLDVARLVQEPRNKQLIDALLAKEGGRIDEYIFYPVESGVFESVIVFKRNDFSPVDVIDLKL